jgi:hypothetical protein
MSYLGAISWQKIIGGLGYLMFCILNRGWMEATDKYARIMAPVPRTEEMQMLQSPVRIGLRRYDLRSLGACIGWPVLSRSLARRNAWPCD